MSITTKESGLSPSLPQEGAQAAQNAGTQALPRADAIGIEIPVVLYASRYSAAGRGLGKTPPPVREETRTVIVFAQGAVVRLSANIAVGEMVVLTNQQTGADVLCRVGAVKAQPGVQNYVDLEFTQRAPGFWEGHSAAGPTTSSERPASEPAPSPRAVATSPLILAPKQHASSPSSPASESVSPVGVAPRVSEPPAAAIPITSAAPESPRSSSARPPAPAVAHAPAVPNAVSNVGAAPRLVQSTPSTLTGEQLHWSGGQSPASSQKGLWAAIAAVFVAGILAGGFLLNRRGQPASPDNAITVAAPNGPTQPTAAEPAHEPQAPVAAEPASGAAAVPVQPPTWLPDTPSTSSRRPTTSTKPRRRPAAPPCRSERWQSRLRKPQRCPPRANRLQCCRPKTTSRHKVCCAAVCSHAPLASKLLRRQWEQGIHRRGRAASFKCLG